MIAAKLLNRVCNHIKMFPKHDTTILTQAVIEVKAGLTLRHLKRGSRLLHSDGQLSYASLNIEIK